MCNNLNFTYLKELIHQTHSQYPNQLPPALFVPFSLWHIWNTRNLNTFNDTHHTISTSYIINHVTKFLFCAHPLRSKNTLISMHVKWEPPKRGSYKLNSDGAACPTIGVSGYGGVIRDSNGNWMVGYTGSSRHTSSLHMELMGLLQGLLIAHHRQLTPLEVAIDAQEERSALHQLADPDVTHIYREQNRVADAMAKHGIRNTVAQLC